MNARLVPLSALVAPKLEDWVASWPESVVGMLTSAEAVLEPKLVVAVVATIEAAGLAPLVVAAAVSQCLAIPISCGAL